MLSPQQLTGMLNQIRKLPQTDETWEVGTWLALTWVQEFSPPPYRPHALLIVSADDFVMRSDMSKPAYTPEDILEHLLRAMRRPSIGNARRPARIICSDAEVTAYITPQMAKIGIDSETAPTSSLFLNVRSSLEQAMNTGESLRPSLASIPGVSLALQAHFYQLAAELYALAPWRVLTDATPIELRYPATAEPRVVIIMGSDKIVYGLTAYDTLEKARSVYLPDALPEEAGDAGIALLYDDPWLMPLDDLAAIEEHGWELAAPNIYTTLVRLQHGEYMQPPLSDLIWTEGALAALIRYVREDMQLDGRRIRPADLQIPVQTVNGPETVILRLPAFDPYG